MKIDIGKNDEGLWELTYDGILGPVGSTVYETQALAIEARDEARAWVREWNARGFADAPHLDNF